MQAHKAMFSGAQPPPTPPDSSAGSSSILSQAAQPHSTRRKVSLSNIVIPSFASFRAQSQPVAHPSPGSIKRKPLPVSASPARIVSLDASPKPALVDPHGIQRSLSFDTPQALVRERLHNELTPVPSSTAETFEPRDLDRFPHGSSANKEDFQVPNLASPTPDESPLGETPNAANALDDYLSNSLALGTSNTDSSTIRPARESTDGGKHTSLLSISEADSRSNYSRHSGTPTMTTFQYDHNSPDADARQTPSPQPPKSPSRRGWFGWNKADNPPTTPSTTFSESNSPMPSPNMNKPLPGLLSPGGPNSQQRSVSAPLSLDIPKANAAVPVSYYTVPGTPNFSTANAGSDHIEELERELREVSSELANSIRREMELEDELERFKLEGPSSFSTDMSKRTSDYYSDSGASSVRFPIGDSEQKLEELERIRRKVEQDKASLKVEMGQRLQTEMQRRKEMEEQLRLLHEQHLQGGAVSERERELEQSLADSQRRLAEEKQFKENFEDLLNAMRDELESLRNERDNLKDEVVPQLRARVEGLETETANSQKAAYDTTKELETLKNARRMQADMQAQASRFGSGVGSIAEEMGSATDSMSAGPGLTRSKSMARSRSNTLARTPSIKGLQRTNSVKGSVPESPQALSDRLKDIEDQRDALHKALKLLLNRQDYQMREHHKRVKALQDERDHALTVSPHRPKFHGEVATLKNEVSLLRQRADEALEQKWQCEKGLSGLRMDLDRAHQETSSLRGILQEHDIPIPSSVLPDYSAGTESLDRAYKELRTTHALSLARVLEMETEDPATPTDGLSAVSQRTIHLLKQSISSAEAERDAAMQAAESYRLQARALQAGEVEHLSKNQSLAAELLASAGRMDELAAQVQQQLEANRGLRQRLADAVGRGEREQRISERRIADTQTRLRELEERVTRAQAHADDVVTLHDDEVRALKDAHRAQLSRLKSSVRGPARFSFLVSVPGSAASTSPVTPLLSAARSPSVGRHSNAVGGSREREPLSATMAEKSGSEELERKVRQLERALKDADEEMEEVVGRMNMAQIEVAELQSARDEATMQTRRLQTQIEAERKKVQQLMA